MSTSIRVCVSTLNQWALDFIGNHQRIRQSLIDASQCHYRLGPDLEICGASCCDEFNRPELYRKSWKVLDKLLREFSNSETVYDIGLPVRLRGKNYITRAICHKGKVKFLIAKSPSNILEKWFSQPTNEILNFELPHKTTDFVTFGIQDFSINNVQFSHYNGSVLVISDPILFTERFTEEKRKLIETRTEEIILCANLIGCDGAEVYYAGNSCILAKGLDLSTQLFSLKDVESIRACLSPNENQPEGSVNNLTVNIEVDEEPTTTAKNTIFAEVQPPIYYFVYSAVCWLWDYLRRSGAKGLFLPLSGGADSACVALLVSLIPRMLKAESVPSDSFAIKTCYFKSSLNSSDESLNRANNLACEIDSVHSVHEIDNVVASVLDSFGSSGSLRGSFNGLPMENLQARTRMIMSYFAAASQDLPLLVLGTGNADESAVGYFTKYDCSSADINLIGDIGKREVRQILTWYRDGVADTSTFVDVINQILNAVPSAELSAVVEGVQAQTDEDDLGITYEDIGNFRQRFCNKMEGLDEISDSEPQKRSQIERFYNLYAKNMHKSVVLPPFLRFFSPHSSPIRLLLFDCNWPQVD